MLPCRACKTGHVDTSRCTPRPGGGGGHSKLREGGDDHRCSVTAHCIIAAGALPIASQCHNTHCDQADWPVFASRAPPRPRLRAARSVARFRWLNHYTQRPGVSEAARRRAEARADRRLLWGSRWRTAPQRPLRPPKPGIVNESIIVVVRMNLRATKAGKTPPAPPPPAGGQAAGRQALPCPALCQSSRTKLQAHEMVTCLVANQFLASMRLHKKRFRPRSSTPGGSGGTERQHCVAAPGPGSTQRGS